MADDDVQRIVVEVDVVPGPFIPAVAELVLRTLADELVTLGVEITRTRVEVHGRVSAW